jgi:hypothetical protein
MKVFFSRLGLLVFGIAFLGFSCNQSNPEQTVERMKQSMANQTSAMLEVAFSGNASVLEGEDSTALQSLQPGAEKVTFRFSGFFDRESEEIGDQQGEFSVEIEGSEPGKVAGQFRSVDRMTYVQLTDLDLGGEFASMVDSNAFLNTWISFPQGFSNPLQMDDSMKEEGDQLTEEEAEALVKAFRDFSLVSEAEVAGSEEINGVQTTQYRVTFDEGGIQLFAEQAANITGEEFTEEDREELIETVRKMNDGNPMMWIGDNDNLLYRFTVSPALQEEGEAEQRADVSLEFSNFGEDVDVEAPESSQSAEELFSSMFGGMMGGMFMQQDEQEDAMMFGDPEEFLQNLEGGDAVDFEELQNALNQLGQ